MVRYKKDQVLRDPEGYIRQCEDECDNLFRDIDKRVLFNQEKVLHAFQNNRIALRHFAPTTGYGYDDVGKNGLCNVFAEAFNAEAALVSSHFASGTHAISTALFGLLRPGDTLFSISGNPYDTLLPVINGGAGSLKDFGIQFEKCELTDGKFDRQSIISGLRKPHKIIYIQRSGGYSGRAAFTIPELSSIIKLIKDNTHAPIVVDNCYGEFVDTKEPLEIGADIIIGSLIKNPGGGIALTGGYIAGKRELLEQIEGRLTAPGIGNEVGSYAAGYQCYYQGVFLAPHTVGQALKSSVLFGKVFSGIGYETLPHLDEIPPDIVRIINFNEKEHLIDFCRTIQSASPVDSFAVPSPWEMPGYSHQVIMAAGTFIQGSSIELSADSPIVAPYKAYVQGGLTFEHSKIALRKCLEDMKSL